MRSRVILPVLLRQCLRLLRVCYLRLASAMARLDGWRRRAAILAAAMTAVYMLVTLSHMAGAWWGSPPGPPIPRNRRGPFEGYRDCTPETHLAFLKTHKCASSTVQNVLLRYASNNQLNVALPPSGNYVGRYRPFHRSALWGTPWHRANMDYNMFCLHTIWDWAEVRSLFAEAVPPVTFTIVRDPVELFISLWDYAKLGNYYGMTLEEYAFANKSGPLRDRNKVTNLGRNQMLWDMGLGKGDFDNDTAIAAKIAEVEDTFHLVMVAEMFDESMVLLRDLLCWTYEDVTSLKLNALRADLKSTVSVEARHRLAEWLRGDYLVYEHFVKKLVGSVQAYGESRMRQEVRILRAANENVQRRCGIEHKDNRELEGDLKLWSNDVMGYQEIKRGPCANSFPEAITLQSWHSILGNSRTMLQVKKSDDDFCHLYGMSEIALLDRLREEQGARAEALLAGQQEGPVEGDGSEEGLFVDVDRAAAVGRVQLNPMEFLDANGRPDIEKLRENFVHGGTQG